MTREEYIQTFKNAFGYQDDYFPKDSCLKVVKELIDELRLQMPTDTAAREVEGDAVMLLVKYGDDNAVKIGTRLGNMLMKHNYDDKSLLSAMADAAKALMSVKKV